MVRQAFAIVKRRNGSPGFDAVAMLAGANLALVHRVIVPDVTSKSDHDSVSQP